VTLPSRFTAPNESVITALIGTTMGLGLGLFLAGLVTRAVDMEGVPFSVPVQTLAAFTLIAVQAAGAFARLGVNRTAPRRSRSRRGC
jgi:putative ABC transport system permease protein